MRCALCAIYILYTSEKDDHARDAHDPQRGQLGEHEHVLEARGDLHRVAVQPGEEADAECGDEGEHAVGNVTLGEQRLHQVVGHCQRHDGVRGRPEV